MLGGCLGFLNHPQYNFSSWWLNQPIWNICLSNWIISPNRDENRKYLKPLDSYNQKKARPGCKSECSIGSPICWKSRHHKCFLKELVNLKPSTNIGCSSDDSNLFQEVFHVDVQRNDKLKREECASAMMYPGESTPLDLPPKRLHMKPEASWVQNKPKELPQQQRHDEKFSADSICGKRPQSYCCWGKRCVGKDCFFPLHKSHSWVCHRLHQPLDASFSTIEARDLTNCRDGPNCSSQGRKSHHRSRFPDFLRVKESWNVGRIVNTTKFNGWSNHEPTKLQDNKRKYQRYSKKRKNEENSQEKNTPIQILPGNLSSQGSKQKSCGWRSTAPGCSKSSGSKEPDRNLRAAKKKRKKSGNCRVFCTPFWVIWWDLDCFGLKLFAGKNNLPTWSKKNVASKINDLCTHWDKTKTKSSLPCAQEQQTTLPLEMAQPQSFRRRTLACGNWPSSTFKPSSPHGKSLLNRP